MGARPAMGDVKCYNFTILLAAIEGCFSKLSRRYSLLVSDISVKIVKVILVKIDFGFRHFSHSIINIYIYYTMLVFVFSETILTND